ncbi:methionyl-tRNA formyltransferase [Pseudacidobacterium ailaaui]|jgi:methionyl-tRNA formyltransferase|uniref:methionyl-tRNA formyltransferase n=1 Tax=Pseudacidobacterium ailaaui TaxID=1382359 RepID=UPI00047DE1F6|nr:methionyl-tRNA formyltransferase [Pseudacidobacterium ailaaui]
MRLVFCGTPQFAVPTLHTLLRAGHDIRLVLTQPDRPQGRGMNLVAPPVKLAAMQAGISVVQPEKIKTNAGLRAQLEEIQPEAIIVVAYGRIIPKWMLDLPKYGNLNLHASLLPKYRGAAPIQWAIANGEPVTGATIMRLDEGLDTGDILLQRELPIAPDQTAEDIFPLLASMGADLMAEALEALALSTITPQKQDESKATLAPVLKREDGRIDFSRPAIEIYNRWRGFQPWPGIYTQFRGKKLVFHRMMPMELRGEESLPARMLTDRDRLFVDCGKNTRLELLEVQLEGKRRMPAADFMRGHQVRNGERLG